MQFLFPEKAAETSNRKRQKHQHSGMLHGAIPWPFAGGYAMEVQILTVGEGWMATIPQPIDMNNILFSCRGRS
jgi:hypothetical protein